MADARSNLADRPQFQNLCNSPQCLHWGQDLPRIASSQWLSTAKGLKHVQSLDHSSPMQDSFSGQNEDLKYNLGIFRVHLPSYSLFWKLGSSLIHGLCLSLPTPAFLLLLPSQAFPPIKLLFLFLSWCLTLGRIGTDRGYNYEFIYFFRNQNYSYFVWKIFKEKNETKEKRPMVWSVCDFKRLVLERIDIGQR